MDDKHRSPYVGVTNNLQWKQWHNCNHFDLTNAYFTKFCLLNLLWNGHYNTSFHIIIISMHYWIMV